MGGDTERNLTRDLFLPTLLFAALGGMTWAVRGCSGYGAVAGCMFAGVTWGAAWWFIARDPAGRQSRAYTSGWIILALLIGIGLSGGRGWMQWPSFFEGKLQTDAATGAFVPISRAYGFLWLFIAGVPWAGIGACMMAWCGSRHARAWEWALRIACGIGGGYLAHFLFEAFPELFLPMYTDLKARYLDTVANHNLYRLTNDSRSAILHLGIYLGLLGAEAIRRDWRNVKLITTVGLLNGIGWALLQNWKWAAPLWPDFNFNWWRCWESSGGISIGIAYGVAYYLVNRPESPDTLRLQGVRVDNVRPNLERFGLYLGLLLGLGFSIRNGLKGWANIYIGNEDYWAGVLSRIMWPTLLAGIVAAIILILLRPLPKGYTGDVFPHAYTAVWLVLIVQNVLAQLVTGPPSEWTERTFSVYYVILFLITAVVVYRVHVDKRRQFRAGTAPHAIAAPKTGAPA